MCSLQKDFIEGPRLGNQYLEDFALQRFLRHFLPQKSFQLVDSDLTSFGDKVAGEYIPYMKEAERNTPRLVKYTAWNEQVDELLLSEGWRYFKGQTAIEGLVALPYENALSEFTRLHYFSKIYLFHPSSGLFTCPIAMSDGCAFLIRSLLKERREDEDSELKQLLVKVLQRLISRSPREIWTSGQWMTERKGGSDVQGATETLAMPVDRERRLFALDGYKFFTSATDSEVAMTLARIQPENKKGSLPSNETKSGGLSLFLVLTKTNGKPNNIEIVRLKEKLGTRQVPTAELKLTGTLAYLLGEEGKGVKTITQLVNVTRIHNAVAAVSSMRRIVNLAKDYAVRRTAFGRQLIDQPLQANILRSLELSVQGNLLMVLEAARLQGLAENGKAFEPDEQLLRLLIPLLKLFTGKEGVRVVSEGLECFGGQGYMEDSFLPLLLRDVQVTPIWEGTTNVQAMDFLRVISKTPLSFQLILNRFYHTYEKNNQEQITKKFASVVEKIRNTEKFILENLKEKDKIVWNMRKIAMNLSRAVICGLCQTLSEKQSALPADANLRDFWLDRCLREWEELEVLTNGQKTEIKGLLLAEGVFGNDVDIRGIMRPKL